MLIENFINDFKEWLVLSVSSTHTVRSYIGDIRQFLSFYYVAYGCQLKVSGLSKHVFRDFILSLNNDPSTVRRKLSSLKSFVKYLLSRRIIISNPLINIRSPKASSLIPRFVDTENLKIMVSAIDVNTRFGLRDRTIVEVMYGCALRVSEVVAVNWEDVQWDTMLLRVYGKGSKERIVPMTDGAVVWLKRLQNFCSIRFGPVFLNKYGKRISTRSVNKMFVKSSFGSGLTLRITPHMVRHCVATSLLENGMGLKSIQQILGHSNVKTTSIYTKVCTSLKSKMLEQKHPLSGVEIY